MMHDSRLLSSCGRSLLITLIFLILSLLIRNSLVPITNWHNTVPVGDAELLGYTLSWGAKSLITNPLDYYNPPIFYPSTNMGFSTDGLELPALLMLPVWLLTHNPFIMMNLLAVAAHFSALLACYFTMRKVLSSERTIAILISILYAINSDIIYHSEGQPNIIWTAIFPLLFYTWSKFFTTQQWRFCILAGTLQGLSIYLSFYFFIFSLIQTCMCFAIYSLYYARSLRVRATVLSILCYIGGSCLAIPKIILYKMASLDASGIRSQLAEAEVYRASWRGYLFPTQQYSGSFLFWKIPYQQWRLTENCQFLGYLLIGLLFGECIRLIASIFRRNSENPFFNYLSIISIILGLICILVSFGPGFTLLGISPYQILYYTLLKYTQFFRMPGRFAFLAHWWLMIPCAIFLSQSLISRNRVFGITILILGTVSVLFDHLPLEPPPSFHSDGGAMSQLMKLDDKNDQTPYVDIRNEMELQAALSAIPDWRPTVNGWPGSATNSNYDSRAFSFMDFPSTATKFWMASTGVPYAIVSKEECLFRSLLDKELSLIGHSDHHYLFKLNNPAEISKSYKSFISNRINLLGSLRERTTESLTWPLSKVFTPSNEPPYQYLRPIEMPNRSLSELNLDVESDITPGCYDIIEYTYKLSDNINHHSRLYWRTPSTLMDGKRLLEGEVILIDPLKHIYKSIFNGAKDYEWMTDDNLSQFRIETHRFESFKAEPAQVISIKLSRNSDKISIPSI